MNSQEKILLKALAREIVGKKTKNLRKNGFIPAVVYGHGGEPQSLSISKKDFEKAFADAGTSTLIDLEIEGKGSVKVLAHEPQINPVTDEPVHVDFYRVKMDKKIKTEIPLEFVGESEAVAHQDGSLVTNRDSIEVECLPGDLVSEIKVDISVLKTFEQSITVKDLNIPPTIEVLNDPEEVIALVEAPRSEEELAELEEPVAAEEEKEALEKMEAEAGAEKAEGAEEGEESAAPEAADAKAPVPSEPEEKK